jgi:DNA polymerase I-like protein with 3'-5' exonuclease and polymerase domains
MTEMFLLFLKLPFEKISYKVISFNGKIIKGRHVNIPQIPQAEIGIVVNLWDYLLDLEKNYDLPDRLFDLNVARKILEGKPKNIFQRNDEPWSGIKILGRSFSDHKVFGIIKSIEDNKYSTFSEWENKLPENWEETLVEAIKKEYNVLISDLRKHNLYDNFVNIEMCLLVNFIKASGNGIRIDRDKLEKRCLELDTRYYSSIRNLEVNHNYFVSDYRRITYEDIKDNIKNPNEIKFSDKYIWEYIDLYRSVDPFLEQLYVEKHARRDLSELLRMTVGISDRCKLQYDIVGTVSGRILITRPGIQYLKKTSRDIFVPSNGYRFIYADYSQFEPGILSFLCEDRNLMDAYNKGDIYLNLAKMISNECSRDVAKKMFLSYIYGMSVDNIRKNIISTFGISAGSTIEIFFNKFPKVLEWKKNIVENSFKEKRVIGLTGYIRYFSDDDQKFDVARWAPNHIIQSTSSGIFKNALVKYINQTNSGRILVPMHDAILIEVREEEYEQERTIICQCMKESFEFFSHGMKCKVHDDNFSSE